MTILNIEWGQAVVGLWKFTHGSHEFFKYKETINHNRFWKLEWKHSHILEAVFLFPATAQGELELDVFIRRNLPRPVAEGSPINPLYYIGRSGQSLADVWADFGLDDVYTCNALKYLFRAGKKDSELQDLKKAKEYIDMKIKLIKNEKTWQESGQETSKRIF